MKMLGLEEGDWADLHRTGLSPDYVRRESKRALIGGEGRCIVYAGIDAGVPVGAPGTAGLPALSPGDAAGIDHDDTSGPDLVRHTPNVCGTPFARPSKGVPRASSLARSTHRCGSKRWTGSAPPSPPLEAW